MREISFKAKCKETGLWLEGTGLSDFLNVASFAGYENDGSRRWLWYNYGWIEVVPETISQYTGLTDKNGVKIFEGDILTNSGGAMYPVKWRDRYADFCWGMVSNYVGKWIRKLNLTKANVTSHELEVSSNIHDEENK